MVGRVVQRRVAVATLGAQSSVKLGRCPRHWQPLYVRQLLHQVPSRHRRLPQLDCRLSSESTPHLFQVGVGFAVAMDEQKTLSRPQLPAKALETVATASWLPFLIRQIVPGEKRIRNVQPEPPVGRSTPKTLIRLYFTDRGR